MEMRTFGRTGLQVSILGFGCGAVGGLMVRGDHADQERAVARAIAGLIAELQKSPQWSHMVVIVTYDENGGFWDHVAPPKGDRWGPGSRIPAIIVSPFAKKGFIDHTQYETLSILKFIEQRWGLAPLGTRDKNASPLAGAL